ncbi:MAG: hypothetical protein IPJ84_03260 [Bdellovibrionales bacterium]|nr:hypothetical protein [Bdellovibrionales bacterium]
MKGNMSKLSPVPFVLLILFFYSYFFTNLFVFIGLPSPQDFATVMNLNHYFHFLPEGALKFRGQKGLGLLSGTYVFISIAAGFILTYFLPSRFRKKSQIFWSLVVLSIVYSIETTAFYLGVHFFVFITLHRMEAFYSRYFSKYISKIKFFIAQLPLVLIAVVVVFNQIAGQARTTPIGIALFCWQWQRLMVYYMDDRDGAVPLNISFSDYLSVFLSPATVLSWETVPYLAQGYSYLSERYNIQRRNFVVWSGVKMLSIALAYYLIMPIIVWHLRSWLIGQGYEVTWSVHGLVEKYVKGESVSSLSVYLSCIFGQIVWFVFTAPIVHMKVGLWRIFGYEVDPHLNKPWLATNLVSFWGRYTFHFKTNLLRVFYFPVFLAFPKKSAHFRIATATIASAGIGNMLWGHFPRTLLMFGMTFEALKYNASWIYYFLLAGGILTVEFYLLWRRKKRRPWQWGWRIGLDVLAFAVTFSYYSLIHVYARPVHGGNIWIYTELFLKGLGLK